MPRQALKVCAQPRCPELTYRRHCPTHAAQHERARGTRQQRGYNAEHDALRRKWKPKVERGEVDCQELVCLEPIRRILPGQPWHLCHDRETGTYRGPGHVRCNTSEGGRAAHSA